MTGIDEDKRYLTHSVEWDDHEKEYVFSDTLLWEGELLQFDTYEQFLLFMQALTEEEKELLGVWRLEDTETGETLIINEGRFDAVNHLSMGVSDLDQTRLMGE